MISQQSYKYSQCVSEHKNPWNHKYIKFQGRTHTGMCCFLCNKHSQLNFAHHVSTRVHDSQHPPLFAISDYVLMWALKSTTTLPFILQRSHFFSVKRVKFEVVSPSSTPKKKKEEIYHVHVKVIRQIISHRNKASYQNWNFYQLRSQLQDFESRNTPWVKNHFVNEIHSSWKTVITVVGLIRKENSNKRIPFSLRRCIKSQKIDWLV